MTHEHAPGFSADDADPSRISYVEEISLENVRDELEQIDVELRQAEHLPPQIDLAKDLSTNSSSETGIEPEEIEDELPIDEIVKTAKNRLARLGLKDPQAINAESIKGLGGVYLDLEAYDIEDLYLHVLGDSIGYYVPVTFSDLVETVIKENVDIEKIQEDQYRRSAAHLEVLGVNSDQLEAWEKTGNPRQKRAVRRMGWILNQAFMVKLKRGFTDWSKTRNDAVGFDYIARAIAPEIEMEKRKAETKAAMTDLTSRQYKEFQTFRQRLEVASAIAELVFDKDLKDEVYEVSAE